MKEIVILFTRVPKEGTTKTRLYDFLTPQDAKKIQIKLLQKLYKDLISWNFDVKIVHSGSAIDDSYMSNILGTQEFYYQRGENLGEKMTNAFADVFEEQPNGKVLLIGSDIVNISEEIIASAFENLDNSEVVIHPTYDGGYYLVGMKKLYSEVFDVENYGGVTVFEQTLQKIKNSDLSYSVGEKCLDIDTKEDLLHYETGFDNISLLGAGEYNVNFLYDHSENEKRVLRLNMRSQMNLKNQMAYEYQTLKLLEKSGVTPKPYDLVKETKVIPYRYLTMEYLPGVALDYNKDIQKAAYLLGKVHTTPYPENHGLIFAKEPFSLMYEECSAMASEYLSWDRGDLRVKEYLLDFLYACENKLEDDYKLGKTCIINTELNSGNFLIGATKEDSYVIDWEKALIGECEQDLAHFLAPTTTFWKTDKILTSAEIEDFLNEYSKYREYDREKFNKYFIFTCLRGVTWCSMAYKQYVMKEKMLTDDFTFNKIKNYLEYSFLENLEKYFNE